MPIVTDCERMEAKRDGFAKAALTGMLALHSPTDPSRDAVSNAVELAFIYANRCVQESQFLAREDRRKAERDQNE